MRGAYRKGHAAGLDGLPAGACPYEDKRKASGRLTWSRAFIAAWHDGWQAGNEQRKQDLISDFYADRGCERRPSTWVR